MRVQTEEWQRLIPGVRMYKGKKTLFWNGEELWDGRGSNGRPLVYDEDERESWKVIIILPGVEVIPEWTFYDCWNVETVIMADDSVQRIEKRAFDECRSLVFVKLSRNLEYIGPWAFKACVELTSIFIPPSCREIRSYAFGWCVKLIILCVDENTRLGYNVFEKTALASPFRSVRDGYLRDSHNDRIVHEWVQNRHADSQFSLHQACAVYNPREEVIFDIVKRQGIGAFKKADSIGVTPSQYLLQNPFADIKEEKIMKRYILDMMGEIVA